MQLVLYSSCSILLIDLMSCFSFSFIYVNDFVDEMLRIL